MASLPSSRRRASRANARAPHAGHLLSCSLSQHYAQFNEGHMLLLQALAFGEVALSETNPHTRFAHDPGGLGNQSAPAQGNPVGSDMIIDQ